MWRRPRRAFKLGDAAVALREGRLDEGEQDLRVRAGHKDEALIRLGAVGERYPDLSIARVTAAIPLPQPVRDRVAQGLEHIGLRWGGCRSGRIGLRYMDVALMTPAQSRPETQLCQPDHAALISARVSRCKRRRPQ